MALRIAADRIRLAEFCRKHHLRMLAFFGSVLRDDFRADSDVDVLYEFEEGYAPGWDIADVEQEISQILGRPVDFVPARYLNRWVRDRVLREAEVQYAA